MLYQCPELWNHDSHWPTWSLLFLIKSYQTNLLSHVATCMKLQGKCHQHGCGSWPGLTTWTWHKTGCLESCDWVCNLLPGRQKIWWRGLTNQLQHPPQIGGLGRGLASMTRKNPNCYRNTNKETKTTQYRDTQYIGSLDLVLLYSTTVCVIFVVDLISLKFNVIFSL